MSEWCQEKLQTGLFHFDHVRIQIFLKFYIKIIKKKKKVKNEYRKTYWTDLLPKSVRLEDIKIIRTHNKNIDI